MPGQSQIFIHVCTAKNAREMSCVRLLSRALERNTIKSITTANYVNSSAIILDTSITVYLRPVHTIPNFNTH